MGALRSLTLRPIRASLRTYPSPLRQFSTSRSWQTIYGFVGLGRMGHPMAANLRSKIAASDSLLINDRSQDAMQSLVKDIEAKSGKAEALPSPREVAERSDIVITCLPDPDAVTACFSSIDPKSLPFAPSGEERLFIDTSTIDPLTSRKVAATVFDSGTGRFVDSPMSGGVVGAEAASLTFMLGAPTDRPDVVERARNVLEKMGKRVMHLGDQGAGLAGKLANNYLLAVSNVATAEAMNLGMKLGLDASVLAELINGSSGRCWSSEVNNPVPGVVKTAPASRDYAGGFGIALMLKDLRLARAAAKEADARLEFAPEAERLYQEVAKVEAGKDFSVVYRWLGRE